MMRPSGLLASEDAEDEAERGSEVGRDLDDTPSEFTELVRSEFASIWRLLRRIGVGMADAEDATQQVFLVVARKWGEVPAGKTKRFLYGTALRIAANARRSFRRRREVPDVTISELSRAGNQEEEVIQRQARAFLDELLAQLPDELRRVFVLAEIEEFTMAAIAELEDIPKGTVASRLRRARSEFYRLLEREQHRNPFQGSIR